MFKWNWWLNPITLPHQWSACSVSTHYCKGTVNCFVKVLVSWHTGGKARDFPHMPSFTGMPSRAEMFSAWLRDCSDGGKNVGWLEPGKEKIGGASAQCILSYICFTNMDQLGLVPGILPVLVWVDALQLLGQGKGTKCLQRLKFACRILRGLYQCHSIIVWKFRYDFAVTLM